MEGRVRFRTVVLLILVLAVSALLVALGPAVAKANLSHAFSREGWELPDQVVEALQIHAGDQVADIGAGEGYFTFRFAGAVGPTGTVFAVDVDPTVIEKLKASVRARDSANVTVILGEYDNPLVPDGEIDLAFVCNTYHHIENRSEYFSALKADLSPGGRLVVMEWKPVPLAHLLLPHGHWSAKELIEEEMGQAGYTLEKSFDFLPGPHLHVFSPARPL